MNAAEGPPLLALDDAGCATITLNRARHLNRLHREDLLTLQAQFAQLAQDATLRVVVLAAQGRSFCAGGATDLALACDFRVGVQGMELRMPAARLGLHYYPSGLRRYVSRLGLQAAKRLFLLAEAVPADELLRIGYLDALAPAAELDTLMQRFTRALEAGAPLALRGMKLSLNEIGRGEFDLKRLRLREARCAVSDDLREGLAAFAERREPRFTGR